MQGKKILLAVSGSIAAYKAAYLVRTFVKSGAEVRVIMTPNSQSFISKLTLSTLSKNDVYDNVIGEDDWNNHVELGLWADVMIVAPATATTISKMANGLSDNIVTAVYLSAKCPVFIAPAMDRDMWTHPSTQRNIQLLESYGNHLLDVGEGELASGLIGKGRMSEPEEIFDAIQNFLTKKKDLANKRVLITAGPTFEAIDPVRFIGNRSSGKMGLALAIECQERGAEVTLIIGPNSLSFDKSKLTVIDIKSSDDMYQAAKKHHEASDIIIFAAAVADYTPKELAENKIKKKEGDLSIELVRTTDIAKSLGEQKTKDQIHVGFALETQNEEANAQRKLEKKNFDLIVLNSLNNKGAGFQHDTNQVTIYADDGSIQKYELKSKTKVAQDIVNTIVNKYVKEQDIA